VTRTQASLREIQLTGGVARLAVRCALRAAENMRSVERARARSEAPEGEEVRVETWEDGYAYAAHGIYKHLAEDLARLLDIDPEEERKAVEKEMDRG